MINRESLKNLVNKLGGLSPASNAIGISGAGLSRLINGQRDIGKGTLKLLVDYCSKNGLDIRDYIFLT